MPGHKLCIPQNDLDCYYNKSNFLTINKFLRSQSIIDNYFFDFINNLTMSSDNISNKMLVLKNSYYVRDKYFFETDFFIELINSINKIENNDTTIITNNLTILIDKFEEHNIPTFFTTNISAHHKKPRKYYFTINEISLSLDNKNDYNSTELVAEFKYYLGNIFDFITKYWNYEFNKDDFINNIVDIETSFSKVILSDIDKINPQLIFNSNTREKFIKKFDINDMWSTIINKYNSEYILYDNDKYLLQVKKIFSDLKNIDKIRDFMAYSVIKKYGLYFGINSIKNYPNTQEDIILDLFYKYFKQHLENIYENNNYDPHKNEFIESLFNSMKKYIKQYFYQTNLFTTQTKHKIIKKIKNMELVIGRQDYTINLDELPKLTMNFYDNIVELDKFYKYKMKQLIGQNINRRFISFNNDILSFNVNAYYIPEYNTMYIPTGITNDSFLDLNQELINIYGSIGCVIGHEFMHFIDDFGSQFDEYGELKHWWNDFDHKIYLLDIQKIRDHYKKISNTSNDITISEDIADVLGVKLCFKSYINTYMSDINFNNISNAQKNYLKKFFKSWANLLISTNLSDSKNFIDEHSTNNIRINAPFCHLNEFYVVFDVKPGHKNYLDPTKRSKILN
ncbi:putative zinc metalloproteinase [Cotonvirus japonicus]|uniref:Zinc metalloproteinase n=1 Tax=Cotonvirus japonicus TaxID=2811091 RepID=A0ABM7NT16_9VIRU|nr:putative zinc metalloproteinase [Cotonvirus japonicus]BCS83320.1 putative zinc metalloproteinase [Cotonvirus japonicus]